MPIPEYKQCPACCTYTAYQTGRDEYYCCICMEHYTTKQMGAAVEQTEPQKEEEE